MNLSATKMDKAIHRVAHILPLLLACTIPFPIKANSFLIIVNVVFFLAVALKNKTFSRGFMKTGLFLLLTGLFLILAIGVLHGQNTRFAAFEIEKNVTLLVFPLLVYQWRTYGIKIEHLLWAFVVGCVLVTGYGFFYSFFFLDDESRAYAFELGHSYYTQYISVHPTYLSIYFAFIFFFLLEIYRKYNTISLWAKTGIVTMMGYSSFMMLFLRSRIMLFGWGLIMTGYVFWRVNRRLKLIVASAVLIFFLLLSFHSEFFLSIDSLGRNTPEALEQRLSIWNGAYQGILSTYLLGAGTGSAQYLLDEGYLKTGYDIGLDYRYNAHNQFLQLLCQNGIVELAAFVFLLFVLFRTAVEQKNNLFIIFLVVTCLAMVTESVLYVQKGIIFFYFFCCSFYYLHNE